MTIERATINQIVQIGVEATPGTAVAATRALNALMMEPSAKTEVKTYAGSGNKYDSVSALGKEWSTVKLSGGAMYNEMIYVLAAMYGYTVTIVGTAGAQKWAFTPNSKSRDAGKTYTIEKGSSDGTGAEKVAGAFMTGWGYKFDRSGFEVSGDMLGGAVTTGITMTASVTGLDLIPVQGNQVDVFLDDTQAALGTTLLNRLLSGEFSHGDQRNPLWVVRSDLNSFANTVEQKPKVEFKIELEADSQGLTPLSHLRTGVTKWLRVLATGPQIGTGPETNKFTHDMAVKVTDIQEFKDKDGVYSVGYTFTPVHDDTWGKAHTLELINEETAL